MSDLGAHLALAALIVLSAAGCVDLTTPRPCTALLTGDPPPRSTEEVEAIVEGLRPVLYPELEGVAIDLTVGNREGDFFWAMVDVATANDPPRERGYQVFHDLDLFDDPPPHDAVVAILAHEIRHIADYAEMEAEDLGHFVYWYMTEDVADYERETDEHALALGCGPGLIEFRRWLYDHVDAETVEQKRRDYYTPEEIEAWMANHD